MTYFQENQRDVQESVYLALCLQPLAVLFFFAR